MIKIDIKRQEVENFIDTLDKKSFKKTYKENKITINNISFEDFKELFCSDEFDFSSEKSNIGIYKLLYNKISSDKNKFYSSIREFIIEKFTENIKFCPYCWKNPLIYFEKDSNSNKRMFQFDHFFPKKIYNKWIINFYNLIPSCNACNHLKWEDNPLNIIHNNWTIFHPHFWNLYLDKWNLKKDFWKNADIKLNYISKNSKFFNLWQKYLNSQDTFNIFNFIQDKRTKIKDEKLKFKNISKTDGKLKDYFFNNYYSKSENEVLKYSNWKLKKDIIDSLIL